MQESPNKKKIQDTWRNQKRLEETKKIQLSKTLGWGPIESKNCGFLFSPKRVLVGALTPSKGAPILWPHGFYPVFTSQLCLPNCLLTVACLGFLFSASLVLFLSCSFLCFLAVSGWGQVFSLKNRLRLVWVSPFWGLHWHNLKSVGSSTVPGLFWENHKPRLCAGEVVFLSTESALPEVPMQRLQWQCFMQYICS